MLDLTRFDDCLPSLRDAYRTAQPFPHVVVDDFLDAGAARRAELEFPTIEHERWLNYMHVNERKIAHVDASTWGPTLQDVFDALVSKEFVDFLGDLTGLDGLLADPTLEGGGLHVSRPGGFLNVHADYTVHPQHRDWRRRVNVLVYLNEHWQPEYGGDLELWSQDMRTCERRIAPLGNRAVIFTTDADSFHGHPHKLECPPGVTRKSLALYYFSLEPGAVVRSTEYRARPGESRWRAALIYADKQALRSYDWVKRRFHLSDRAASRLLGRARRGSRE